MVVVNLVMVYPLQWSPSLTGEPEAAIFAVVVYGFPG